MLKSVSSNSDFLILTGYLQKVYEANLRHIFSFHENFLKLSAENNLLLAEKIGSS